VSLEEILEKFGEALRTAYGAIGASHAQPEDQLKHPVVQLMQELGNVLGVEIVATTEAVMVELKGRPDVAIAVDDAKQWKKFRNHPNLLYTDGNEWSLYRTGERQGKVVRLSGDATTEGGSAISKDNVRDLEILLRDFTSWEPIVPTSPRGLAEALAPLCRLLRDDAFAALDKDGSAMQMLADEWRHFLFADADDRQFADAYAQTVTYALLLARVEGEENLSANAADRLDVRHGLLAQVLRILAQKEARAEVKVPLDLLERIVGAVDPMMMAGGADVDPWLYFYEDFLAAYDPKLRNNRGVYYTPAEVVRAQVRLVTELLHEQFDKGLGIVDDGVVLLDPAAGTGTYLLAAIDEGLAEATARFGPGEAAGRATSAARNFHGFEILVGPYAVAHLRVAQRILERGGTLPEDGARVYLADTLESPYVPGKGKQTSLTHRKLSEENERARKVKADERVLVCIGNPPYDRQQIDPDDEGTERKGGWVRFGDDGEDPILDDFIEPVRESGAGGQLKNLYNDYVYFWRWAMWKVFEQSGAGGVVSFITASSYLRGPAFAGMRKVMRATFDELWILDLGGDNLGARRSENVFAIQTPVAIAVGVRTESARSGQPAKVRYCGALVDGTQEEKLERLASIEAFADLEWEDCFSGWEEPLLPEREGNYMAWPLLTDLFPWQHSGIQFKRTWPISVAREVLDRRWADLVAATPDERVGLMRSTAAKNPTKSARDLRAPSNELIPIGELTGGADAIPAKRIAYRSFDRQWMLPDARLIDRPRPPLWHVDGPEQVFITSLLTGLLGEGPAATAAADIPDLDHFRGSFGAKHVIPLWRDAQATEPNVTSGLLEALAATIDEEVLPQDLLAYVYAVLAGDYTGRFTAELEIPGPRIPITKDAGLFKQTAALGRQLIWLHTYGERFVPDGDKHGVVPPGAAKCTIGVSSAPDAYPESFEYDRETKRLTVGSGAFEPVAPEVWDFSVSGLKVVKSWLAYRMKEGAGKRSSTLDDIRPEQWPASFTEELCKLLWIVEQTIDLAPRATTLLADVVDGPVFEAAELPIPSAEERAAPKVDRGEPEQLTIDPD
jgi:Type ISP C-terminal specificity domain/N-6 DNA Methylase